MRARALLLFTVLLAACTPTGARPAAPAPAAALERSAQPLDRQVVRRGRMDVKVEEVEPARRRLEQAVASLGGQVMRYETRDTDRADYVLRVPPTSLDALMDSAAALGGVGTRIVSAEDVTDQMVDADGRLQALRASRDRLQQLLEQASGVTEIVTVERELARVQGEIESLEARLNALRGQVAMSELAVALERRLVPGPLTQVALGLGKIFRKLFIWR